MPKASSPSTLRTLSHWLAPAAIYAIAPQCIAAKYMNVDQARTLIFPVADEYVARPMQLTPQQMQEIAYAYRYLFTSEALEGLTETVLRLCGGDFQDIVYTGSGSEAVESAMKMGRNWHRLRGDPQPRMVEGRERDAEPLPLPAQ